MIRLQSKSDDGKTVSINVAAKPPAHQHPNFRFEKLLAECSHQKRLLVRAISMMAISIFTIPIEGLRPKITGFSGPNP